MEICASDYFQSRHPGFIIFVTFHTFRRLRPSIGTFSGFGLLVISIVVFFMAMPVTKVEKKNAFIKLIWIALSTFMVSIVILNIQEYYTDSFLVFQLFVGYHECIHGIILPLLFINNLPNLKSYILDKLNSLFRDFVITTFDYSRTIYETISGLIPRRENQIDVMV